MPPLRFVVRTLVLAHLLTPSDTTKRSVWEPLQLNYNFTKMTAAFQVAVCFRCFFQEKHAIDCGFDLMQCDPDPSRIPLRKGGL